MYVLTAHHCLMALFVLWCNYSRIQNKRGCPFINCWGFSRHFQVYKFTYAVLSRSYLKTVWDPVYSDYPACFGSKSIFFIFLSYIRHEKVINFPVKPIHKACLFCALHGVSGIGSNSNQSLVSVCGQKIQGRSITTKIPGVWKNKKTWFFRGPKRRLS